MLDVEGFILVGGKSSRMGQDKSRLLFGGQTSVERIAAGLQPTTSQVTLVGSANPNPDFQVAPDLHPSWGALGGIHAALSACRADWAMIVACDTPFVTRDLFSRLQALSQQDLPDAVAPIQPDGRPQPLCALYRREPCLREAEHLIANGEHTPRALLGNVRTRWVQPEELADLSGAENFFFNVNTPADYEQAQQMLLPKPDSAPLK